MGESRGARATAAAGGRRAYPRRSRPWSTDECCLAGLGRVQPAEPAAMSSDPGHWCAGAAVVPFPTVVGTPLAGYAARTGPAEDTHDELTIGALVLRWGNRRLGIV